MKRIALSALICAAPMACIAADAAGQWYVNPQAGGIFTDHRRATDNGGNYALGVGTNFSNDWSAELNLGAAPHLRDRFDPNHLDLYAGSLDLLRVFNREGTFAPYISVGAGAERNDPSVLPGFTHLLAQAGLGVMVKLWESPDGSSSFALRPDLKARWDQPGGGAHLVDYVAMLGVQYSFGKAAPVAVAAAPPPPPPPPVAQPASEPPPPVPVAPLDSDHDGVPDSIDQCPNTPPGVSVDAVGCPLKGSITLEGVNFEFNSATLTPEAQPILDTVADGLRKHPRLKIELQGYTDSRGSPQYNLGLSSRRVNSVKDYLVAHQVPASQLTAEGYGEADPVASNKTDEGRARNRRVVMKVLDNPGDVKIEGTGEAK